MDGCTFFEKIKQELQNGTSVVLCSLISADGSAPRGAGAKMAVLPDGEMIGTIGGGAVEHEASKMAMEIHRTKENCCRGYDLIKGSASDVGMICGGRVTVAFFLLDEQHKALLDALCERLQQAENVWLLTQMEEHVPVRMGLYDEAHGLRFAEMAEDELHALLRTKPVYRSEANGIYAEPVNRAGEVFVFGGGHVGQALVPALHAVGFRVTVYDNREEMAKAEKFPQAQRVICGSYLEIEKNVKIGGEDYVVILTPAHQADREVLLQAMQTDACYIGCIGSRSKIAATNAYLVENGVREAELARIHAPIGLPILAQTPEEIAVSITAQLIEHRARRAAQ